MSNLKDLLGVESLEKYFGVKRVDEEKELVTVVNNNADIKTEDNYEQSKDTEKKNSYICETCGKKLSSYNYLMRHKRTKCNKSRNKCDVCGATFSFFNTLIRHKLVHCDQRSSNSSSSSSSSRGSGREAITLHLKWDGESWAINNVIERNLYYRVRLGRDLHNLLDKQAIKEESLNYSQVECVSMYRKLFSL